MLSPIKSFIVYSGLLFTEHKEQYFLPQDYSLEAKECSPMNDIPMDIYWFPLGEKTE